MYLKKGKHNQKLKKFIIWIITVTLLSLLKFVGKEQGPKYFRPHFSNWFSMSDKKEKQSKLRK